MGRGYDEGGGGAFTAETRRDLERTVFRKGSRGGEGVADTRYVGRGIVEHAP